MKAPLRVLYLCETAGIGGAETVVFHLATRLDRSRVKSDVVLMQSGWLADRLAGLGVETIPLQSTRRLDIGFVLRLRALARRLRIDVLHSHLPDANAYACLACAGTGTRVVATYHGLIGREQSPSRAARLKLGIVRRLSSRTVAVSSALREELVESLAFSAPRTRVIHNGVDWTPFDEPVDTGQLRHALNIDPSTRIVGMVANLRPAKGYEFYVRAAAQVIAALPNILFLVIGEEEPRLKAQLQEEIRRLGLGDSVRFLGARDDVPALLRILDVFALSSISEGMSIATVEAMGAGVPVVVTRSGGPEDIVEDGTTGLLVPPGDAAALAEGIKVLLADRLRAGTMALAARATARERFSLDRMVEQYSDLYEEVACS